MIVICVFIQSITDSNKSYLRYITYGNIHYQKIEDELYLLEIALRAFYDHFDNKNTVIRHVAARYTLYTGKKPDSGDEIPACADW